MAEGTSRETAGPFALLPRSGDEQCQRRARLLWTAFLSNRRPIQAPGAILGTALRDGDLGAHPHGGTPVEGAVVRVLARRIERQLVGGQPRELAPSK